MSAQPQIEQDQRSTPETFEPVFKKYIIGVDDSSGPKEYIIDERSSPNITSTITQDAVVGGNVINFQDQLLLDPRSEEELISKLKSQNAAYRDELKSLSEQLTGMISKHKVTKTETNLKLLTASVPDSHPETRLQKEIETARKSAAMYRKEVKQLKAKYEDMERPNKRGEIENKIFQINLDIEKENAAKRALNKLIRDKTRSIEHFEPDLVMNMKESVLLDDLHTVQEKYRQINFNEERLMTQSKSREDYAGKLERELGELRDNYKKAIEKTGYVEKPEKSKVKIRSLSRPRNMNDNTVTQMLPTMTSPWKQNREDDIELLQYDEDNFNKFLAHMKIIKKADLGREKTLIKEQQDLESQILIAEKHRKKIMSTLAEKEKEVSELDQIFKELAAIASQNNIPLPSEERLHAKKAKVFEKRSSTKTPDTISLPKLNPKSHRDERETKKEKKEEQFGEFNDKDIIGNQNVKICGVRVWHDRKRLCGIQGIYKTHVGRKFEGKKHVKDDFRYKVMKFELEGDDFVKDVNGYLNASGDVVECLVFKSFYGENRKVGTVSEDARLFRFDIDVHEFPAIIYGTVREDQDGCVLSKLGVLIASDEIEVANTEEKEDNFFDKTSVPSKRNSNVGEM